MKNHIYIILAIFNLAMTVQKSTAQNCQVNGVVTESGSHTPVSHASIVYSLGGKRYSSTTNSKGHFVLNIPQGANTTIKITHIGYKPTSKLIIGSKKQQTIRLEMVPEMAMLDEIVIKRKIPLATQRGDTTIYKASDFKSNVDANALDLMQKIPGSGMNDGKLEVHGLQVKEITIDGRKFFESDVNLALKNLPANVIDEIQIFDQLSEYSKLTGFDDGNTTKTINLKTKKGTSKSHFGKVTAGGGIDEVYKLYGMYNMFHDDIRWSVFAQLNNINEQNFSMIDLLSSTGTASSSAPSQSPYSKGASDNTFHPTSSDDISSMMVDVSDYGVTTSRAVGTNYSDEWMKGKMKYVGHYLFNRSTNYTDYHILDYYFGKTSSNNLQDMRVDNNNLNHRFSTKYEYQITPSDYLLLRPALAYQKKDEVANLTDWTVKPDDLDSTALLLNQKTFTDQYVTKASGEVMFLHKFSTQGHALTANVRTSYMYTHEDISMDFDNVQTGDVAVQSTMCKNTQETYAYMLSYIQPVGDHIRLKLDGGWNKTYGLMRRKTEIMANGATEFSVDTLLSGSTWSNFGGLLVNASYMMNYKRLNLVAGTEYQKYNLYNANDRYYYKRSYSTFLPYAFLRFRLTRGQLHVQYKASNNYPGLAQVHDAINNVNAVMAIRGNIKLEPSYQHSLMARLILPISKNGSVFVFFTNIVQADNYIGSLRSLASESYQEEGERRNTQILSYKNTDGYFSWTSLVAYGIPWKVISSNVNFTTRVSKTSIPGYWDNNKQYTDQWNWSGSITVGSNISENVDFVLDVNSKYTNSKNQTFEEMNVNYWALSYGGQLNWQFIRQLKLVLECGRTNYFGSGTSQFNAVISNAAVAYKFLKGQKGELRFQINDILNQDNSFYQTTTELYRREMTTNILGRYAMLSFTYNLNTNR